MSGQIFTVKIGVNSSPNYRDQIEFKLFCKIFDYIYTNKFSTNISSEEVNSLLVVAEKVSNYE